MCGKKFKGWDLRGIRRFNNIVAAIKQNRELNTSKEMEMKLKANYVKLSGKGVETEDGGSEEDIDDLDEVNGYDGFAGIVQSEMSQNQDVSCVTNITAV